MVDARQILTVARAEALFTSELSAYSPHSAEQIATAIARTIRARGGVRGCMVEVAGAYGDHPETAAARMRWARGIIDQPHTAHRGRDPVEARIPRK